MSERIKIDFHDGHGEVSDAWGVTVDGVHIGAFYLRDEEKRWPIDEESRIIQFHFGWVREAQLTIKPQDNMFKMRRYLSEFTPKGE